MLVEILGWISSVAFWISAVPQAVQSYKEGHSRGISKWMMYLWLLGEVSGFFYAIGLGELPLTLNFGFGILLAGIVTWYIHFPRER